MLSRLLLSCGIVALLALAGAQPCIECQVSYREYIFRYQALSNLRQLQTCKHGWDVAYHLRQVHSNKIVSYGQVSIFAYYCFRMHCRAQACGGSNNCLSVCQRSCPRTVNIERCKLAGREAGLRVARESCELTQVRDATHIVFWQLVSCCLRPYGFCISSSSNMLGALLALLMDEMRRATLTSCQHFNTCMSLLLCCPCCISLQLFCRGGQAQARFAPFRVTLEQCGNAAFGERQRVAKERWLSPCGWAFNGSNQCDAKAFQTFYGGESQTPAAQACCVGQPASGSTTALGSIFRCSQQLYVTQCKVSK